jgi:hypothetical protein
MRKSMRKSIIWTAIVIAILALVAPKTPAQANEPVPQSVPVGGIGLGIAQAKILDNGVTVWGRVFNDTNQAQTGTVEFVVAGEMRAVNFTVKAGEWYEFVKVEGWRPTGLPPVGTPALVEFRILVGEYMSPWESRMLSDYRGLNQRPRQIGDHIVTNGCQLDLSFMDDPNTRISVRGELVAEGHLNAEEWWSDRYGSWIDVSKFADADGIPVDIEATWTGFAPLFTTVNLTGCLPPPVTSTPTSTPSSTPTATLPPENPETQVYWVYLPLVDFPEPPAPETPSTPQPICNEWPSNECDRNPEEGVTPSPIPPTSTALPTETPPRPTDPPIEATPRPASMPVTTSTAIVQLP